jgi:hypothetical protein
MIRQPERFRLNAMQCRIAAQLAKDPEMKKLTEPRARLARTGKRDRTQPTIP